MFEENVKIRYSEMDCNLVLKPSAFLQFLQDLASNNAEALGFGYSYIIKKNLAWFLLKYHIEFDDYPQGIYDLTIQTEPRGYNKLFAYRDFKVLHQNKKIGQAISSWALVNIDNKNMTGICESLNDNPHMKQFEKKENDLTYNKIKIPNSFEKEKIFDIRFDDLDVNKHVNNVNYIIWAFEVLDFDFRQKHKLKTLDMVFKKEITFGSRVISFVTVENNITTHLLKCEQTGDELCLIKAEWTVTKN